MTRVKIIRILTTQNSCRYSREKMIFTLFLLTFAGNHIHFVQVIFKKLKKNEKIFLKDKVFTTFIPK